MQSTHDFELTLLENGFDFIASGLRYLSKIEKESDLKYAVLHLAAGIELVLKAKLMEAGWEALFDRVEEADREKFETGDFRSCSLAQCIIRLEEHFGIQFSEDETGELSEFARRRNRLQHFQITESREGLQSLAMTALDILLDFIGEHFDQEDLERSERGLLGEIRRTLGDFNRYVAQRAAEIQKLVASSQGEYGDLIQCPACRQEFLVPDTTVNCLFCRYSADCQNAARSYIRSVLGLTKTYCLKEGMDYPLHTCSQCDNEALVGVEEEKVGFICFGCGDVSGPWDLKVCPFCGRTEAPDSFVGDQCSECFRNYVNQDNS